jgi:molybdopterin-synthase adenylyltransferase
MPARSAASIQSRPTNDRIAWNGAAGAEADDDRYARQRLIPGWDQARLAKARVVVAGAGALGNELLKLLALVGVGRILVVDFDVVAPSNLARTVFFRDTDVGRPKASLAAERVRAVNPDVRAGAIQGDIGRDLGLGALRRADLVLAGLDSVNARWALNRRCILAGAPWIDGGIGAAQGQVTRYVPGRGACYECTFSAATVRRFNARYSCTGLARRDADLVVPTTAVTASLVAALQVHEALRLLHDPASGLPPGHRLTVLLDGQRQIVDELPVDPMCAAHAAPVASAVALAGGAADVTPADVAGAAGSAGVVDLGFDLVAAFACPRCGRREDVGRPAALVYDDESVCPACGAPRRVDIDSTVGPESPFRGRPLASLGVADREMLRVVGDGGEDVWVEIGGADPWNIAANQAPDEGDDRR